MNAYYLTKPHMKCCKPRLRDWKQE